MSMRRALLSAALSLFAPAALAGPGAGVRDAQGLQDDEPVVLRLRFADPLGVRLVDGRLRSLYDPSTDPALARLQAALEAQGGALRPTLDPAAADALRARAAATSGRPQPDLASGLSLDLPARALPGLAAARASAQAAGLLVWSSAGRPAAPPPADQGSPTPDYSDRQGYLDAEDGIGAREAWALGLRGGGVGLSDVEYGWNLDHEDLEDIGAEIEPGQTVPDFVFEYGWEQHGTAVIGQTSASDNGFGVTGGAPEAALRLFPEWSDEQGERRARAINAAINASAEGDVVLLEMQLGIRCADCYGPAELDPAVWEVVRAGVDAGVVIVGAAGNGGEDLDDGLYDDYRSWGDSGAILVGAGASNGSRDALSFSTHGARVSLQGWGASVFSTGYGWFDSIDGELDQAYVDAFGGTSSASPIVASAAVLVQGAALELLGAPLPPEALRALLIETGKAQGRGAQIGPLPDVIAAVRALDADLDGVAGPDWGGLDCDDADPDSFPGAAEVWYNGADNACDGGDDFDQDADGLSLGDDCDDEDPDAGACDPSAKLPIGCAAPAPALGLGALAGLLAAGARRRRDRSGGPA
jgi:hypothetical protein